MNNCHNPTNSLLPIGAHVRHVRSAEASTGVIAAYTLPKRDRRTGRSSSFQYRVMWETRSSNR